PTGTRNWYSTHATAVASAIVGESTGFLGVTGIAPDATLLTGAFASGFDSTNGVFENQGNTALAFAMFALTDQETADSVADALGIERYEVATVVNLSFGRMTANARQGEDHYARIVN